MHAYSFRMWFLTLAVTDNVLFEGDARVMRMRVEIAHKRRAPCDIIDPTRALGLVQDRLRAIQPTQSFSGLSDIRLFMP